MSIGLIYFSCSKQSCREATSDVDPGLRSQKWGLETWLGPECSGSPDGQGFRRPGATLLLYNKSNPETSFLLELRSQVVEDILYFVNCFLRFWVNEIFLKFHLRHLIPATSDPHMVEEKLQGVFSHTHASLWWYEAYVANAVKISINPIWSFSGWAEFRARCKILLHALNKLEHMRLCIFVQVDICMYCGMTCCQLQKLLVQQQMDGGISWGAGKQKCDISIPEGRKI